MTETLGVGITATYGKIRVTILEVVGSGFEVLPDGQPEHRKFWVPASKLSSLVVYAPVKKSKPSTPPPSMQKPKEEILTCDSFIAWLRENSRIVAKMPDIFYNKFAAKYEAVTGRKANPTMNGLCLTIAGRSRWYSIHIYFKHPPVGIPLPENVKKVRGCIAYSAGYDCAIYSNAFAWELLSQGFQLGKRGKNVSAAA